MKIPILSLLAPCLLAAWTPVHGVELGDSRDAVLAELGQPVTAAVVAPDLELLTYPKGEIRLREGAVCYILLSTEPLPRPTASTPEVAAQLRIAELEARLAAMRVRLARAEADARASRSSAAAYRAVAFPAPRRGPAPGIPPTSDAAVFAAAGSGL